jgi:hypothetical protein
MMKMGARSQAHLVAIALAELLPQTGGGEARGANG